MAEVCPYSPEEIPKRIGSTDLVRRFESGEVGPQDFVARLCRILGAEISFDEFCRIWSSIFLPETLIPETLVEALHRRHRLVLLSNTNAIHFAMIRENYPIVGHFDEYVLSHEVGALKPNPKIYQVAIEKALCAPAEILYIDDMPAFVEGGRAAGMEAVEFRSAEQLQLELRRRGVAWE